MVDVSAQANCTITPINPTTLITVLSNGAMNVMIRCRCSEDNGSAITIYNVTWYDPDGNLVPRFGTNRFLPGAPYQTKPSTSGDVGLVIPTFNDSYDGAYTCGRRNARPPIASVNFIIDGELL